MGDRVVVATMVFNPDEPLVLEIAHALAAAAKRGARVNLIVDAYNFLIDTKLRPGPLWYGKKLSGNLREPYHSRLAVLHTIDLAGGIVTITNVPGRRLTIPQSGRSHMKGAIVNNRLYIGGCNLNRAELIDVMVGWQDPPTADRLYRWFQEIAEIEQVRVALEDVDSELDINTHTRLLLDAGVPKQSIIYEEALQLIDAAHEWVFMTCQYFPGGKTAQRLQAAEKRGVRVEVIFSHPKAHGAEAPLQHINILRERTRVPARFFAQQLTKGLPKLHAKIIATEQGAFIGSHNYVPQGVRLGTAEIALLVKDSQFSNQLKTFMENEIQQALKLRK